jgi:hypothetical protein
MTSSFHSCIERFDLLIYDKMGVARVMQTYTNRLILCLLSAVVLAGTTTLAQAASYNVSFDPFDGMGGGDWAPETLLPGSDLATVNTVYTPDFGIIFGENSADDGQASLGECCGGNYFLNVGKAADGNLHWFVNAAGGGYFPAGSTISVSWNNNSGGPSALKAYAGTIDAGDATVDNANDGGAFGGLVGSVVHGPEQYPTLNLMLTADAKSFAVHQSAFDFANDDSFITGEFMGEPIAPNASINGLSYQLVPEPTTFASLAIMIGVAACAMRRRHSAV